MFEGGGFAMVEIGQTAFEREVIEASRDAPVLVDFWAPWCGPCRVLGPMLERLEREYAGRFRLVKINSEENADLAAQFRVRSIPYVVAFADGEPVDAFVGALPEPRLREFIDRLLPNPAEVQRRKAHQLAEAGQPEQAVAAMRAALALDPGAPQAQLDMAELLLERLPAPVEPARIAEAEQALGAVAPKLREDPRWKALSTRLASLKGAASGADGQLLRTRVAGDPADLQARLDLAQWHIARREFEPALAQLIEVVERDRAFGDDAGRRTMLSVFELAAREPQLVSAYRKRLAAALNR
jgi:putative thioredoxin